MSGQTNWDPYSVPELAGILNESLDAAWEQVGAWYSAQAMLDDASSQLEAARKGLAAVWPPESSPAATTFFSVVDTLTDSMRQTSLASNTNGNALFQVLTNQESTKTQVDQLHSTWTLYQKLAPMDPVDIADPTLWQSGLNTQAQQHMAAADKVINDYAATLVTPQVIGVPGWFDPVTVLPGTDGTVPPGGVSSATPGGGSSSPQPITSPPSQPAPPGGGRPPGLPPVPILTGGGPPVSGPVPVPGGPPTPGGPVVTVPGPPAGPGAPGNPLVPGGPILLGGGGHPGPGPGGRTPGPPIPGEPVGEGRPPGPGGGAPPGVGGGAGEAGVGLVGGTPMAGGGAPSGARRLSGTAGAGRGVGGAFGESPAVDEASWRGGSVMGPDGTLRPAPAGSGVYADGAAGARPSALGESPPGASGAAGETFMPSMLPGSGGAGGRRTRRSLADMAWDVPIGGPAVLIPTVESDVHDPGPGVIGIDR